MTWWSPADVYGFAQQGGFGPQDAKKAVAVAFASSGGADHYQWAPGGGSQEDLRGLWALTAGRDGVGPPGELFLPVTSARVVQALWSRYGKTWSWHHAVRVDTGAYVRDVLNVLDQGKGWRLTAKQALPMVRQLAQVHHAAEQMRSVAGGMTLPI